MKLADFKIRHLFSIPLLFVSLYYVWINTWRLMVFLSAPAKISIEQKWIVDLLDNWSRLEITVLPLIVDAALVIVFMLLHSSLSSNEVKNAFKKAGIPSMQRSFYNLITAGSLYLLLEKWQTAPAITLWKFDIETEQLHYWVFSSVHFVAWFIIYGGVLMLDILELLGVKDVYCDICNLSPPILYKGENLIALYDHIRHPSFTALSVILWFTNVMTIDRFLLAVIWTTYMKIAWGPDQFDVAYQRSQLHRKANEILN